MICYVIKMEVPEPGGAGFLQHIQCHISHCLNRTRSGPYAKFLNRAHLFLKRGTGDLIFTTCDFYSLNNVVFDFRAHT